MGFSLVDLIRGKINDEVINLVSRAVSGSNEQTEAGLSSIIPALLTHLSKITSSKLAREALFQSISQQDETILDNLTQHLIDDNHKALVRSGAFSVNSLLGIRGIKSLVDGVSRSSGLSSNSSSLLLGISMPLVLSAIKNKLVEEDNLSSAGVAEFFQDQKASIAEHLPTNFFETADVVTNAERDVTRDRAINPSQTQPHTQTDGSSSSFVVRFLPLLLLPIIFFFSYQFFYKKAVTPFTLPAMVSDVRQGSQAGQNNQLTKEETKSLDKLYQIFDSVEILLNEITDTRTAKAKLTGLEKKVESLNELSLKMRGMSPATKTEAASLVRSRIPQMQATINRINKIPGGTSAIEPIIDKLIQISVDSFI